MRLRKVFWEMVGIGNIIPNSVTSVTVSPDFYKDLHDRIMQLPKDERMCWVKITLLKHFLCSRQCWEYVTYSIHQFYPTINIDAIGRTSGSSFDYLINMCFGRALVDKMLYTHEVLSSNDKDKLRRFIQVVLLDNQFRGDRDCVLDLSLSDPPDGFFGPAVTAYIEYMVECLGAYEW